MTIFTFDFHVVLLNNMYAQTAVLGSRGRHREPNYEINLTTRS